MQPGQVCPPGVNHGPFTAKPTAAICTAPCGRPHQPHPVLPFLLMQNCPAIGHAETLFCTLNRMMYRIAENFCWCKFSWKCVRTLQKNFLHFLFLWNESTTLWPHPYQMMATPHSTYPKKWHRTTKQSKLVQQWPILPFAWRPSRLWKYQDCMPVRARNWLVERKDSALLISNSTTLERFLPVRWYFVYMRSSRLSLFCSDPLQGRLYFRGRQTAVADLET